MAFPLVFQWIFVRRGLASFLQLPRDLMATMNFQMASEQELSLKMDRRTLAQQAAEIRHLRNRLRRLTGGTDVRADSCSVTEGNQARSLAA